METVAVLFANGFEEVEGLTQVDFLRRAGINVIMAGVGDTKITGGHDITIVTDVEVSELQDSLDGIIIPGGMPGAANVAASKKAINLIQKLYNSGKLVAAICAAPAVVLSPAGVLTGKKATCYPGYEDRLTDSHFVEDRVVKVDNVITSRGPGTAAEFAIEIIRYLKDDETAKKIHQQTLQK
jgi:4-methyl-5(b-hydroxyethyl)-thiazole monophosphate biosynthesis